MPSVINLHFFRKTSGIISNTGAVERLLTGGKFLYRGIPGGGVCVGYRFSFSQGALVKAAYVGRAHIHSLYDGLSE